MKKVSRTPGSVATINGHEIFQTDLSRKTLAYQEMIARLRAQYGQAADFILQASGITLDPRASAMNELIHEALLTDVAARMGVSIGSDYIAEKLANPLFVQQELYGLIPAEILDQFGAIDMNVLKAYLHHIGLSSLDFETKVADSIKRTLMMQLIKLAVHVPLFELKEEYVAQNLRKKYSILVLPFAEILKQEKAKKITPEELTAFFNKENTHSKRYWIPEKRSGVVWSINPESYGVGVSDREIKDYYEDNKAKRYIEAPAKVQVRHILFKISSEADRPAVLEKAKKVQQELVKDSSQFASLAKTYSDDKETADDGGLIPYFARGEKKERDFEKAAFILKNDSDISELVPTSQGYELIQRVDKKQPQFKLLDSVQKEISDLLVQEKFREIFAKEMRQLSEQPKKLEETLRDKDAKSMNIDAITQDDAQWGKVLFNLQHKGETSYFVDKGVGQVVELVKIEEANLPTLESLKNIVSNDLSEERAEKVMQEKLAELQKSAIKTGLKELHAAHGGNLETTDWLSKNDSEELAELRKKEIPVDQLFQLERIGAVASFAGADRNGYVMRLDEIEPFDEKQFEEKKGELTQGLEYQRTRLFLAGFVASSYRNATIEQSVETSVPQNQEDYSQYED